MMEKPVCVKHMHTFLSHLGGGNGKCKKGFNDSLIAKLVERKEESSHAPPDGCQLESSK